MIIDANIILKYMLNDIKELADESAKIIENNKVILLNEVIADIVYVLQKVYDFQRIIIANRLQQLIRFNNINVTNLKLIHTAFEYYHKTNFDFIDCILLSYSETEKIEIVTFDKQLAKYLKKNK